MLFLFYYDVIMTQRGLRLQCNVPKHGPILSCNVILVWVLQPSYLLRNTWPSISVCVGGCFFTHKGTY